MPERLESSESAPDQVLGREVEGSELRDLVDGLTGYTVTVDSKLPSKFDPQKSYKAAGVSPAYSPESYYNPHGLPPKKLNGYDLQLAGLDDSVDHPDWSRYVRLPLTAIVEDSADRVIVSWGGERLTFTPPPESPDER